MPHFHHQHLLGFSRKYIIPSRSAAGAWHYNDMRKDNFANSSKNNTPEQARERAAKSAWKAELFASVVIEILAPRSHGVKRWDLRRGMIYIYNLMKRSAPNDGWVGEEKNAKIFCGNSCTAINARSMNARLIFKPTPIFASRTVRKELTFKFE